MKFINNILIALIISFRPLLGPRPSGWCKFEVGCTEYAIHTLKTEKLFKSIFLIIKRLLNCQPFSKNNLLN